MVDLVDPLAHCLGLVELEERPVVGQLVAVVEEALVAVEAEALIMEVAGVFRERPVEVLIF